MSTQGNDGAHSAVPAANLDDTVAQLEARLADINLDFDKLMGKGLETGAGQNTLEQRERIVREMDILSRMREHVEFKLARIRRIDPHQREGATSRTYDLGARPVIPTNLPKFRQGIGSYDEPNEFLFQFQRTLETAGLTLEQHGRRLLPYCFDSDMSEWAETAMDPKMGWDDVKNAFLNTYGDPDRVFKARIALCDAQMMPGETLIEFSQRFVKMMRAARISDPGENLPAVIYRVRLPPEVRFQVDTELRRLGRPEVSVQQLIGIATTSAWTPPTPPRSGKPGRTDSTARPVPSSRPRCQLHGLCSHTTEECRDLQARKHREEPKATDKQADRTTRRPGPFTRSQAAGITCFHYRQKGHIAEDCPDKKLVAKRAVVKYDNAAVSNGAKLATGPVYRTTIRLNGQEHDAVKDTGANMTFISKRLATSLGVTIQPLAGKVRQTAPKSCMPLVGITTPILFETPHGRFHHRCAVLPKLDGPQVLIGSDLVGEPPFIQPCVRIGFLDHRSRRSPPSDVEREYVGNKLINNNPADQEPAQPQATIRTPQRRSTGRRQLGRG